MASASDSSDFALGLLEEETEQGVRICQQFMLLASRTSHSLANSYFGEYE
ncbi:uncharacterized protein RSE6_10491 [Rhynchosporium secalis]|uniref:Uncharacterized protein n=1 Tax=Rhynchosporium secalis TaxID=38038 RepID=A0A1E1MKN5_RHYSE|nr:uncharacterized protein RSE6_10491 [Rhynchosporium secalis]